MSFYLTPLGKDKILISGVNGAEKSYDLSFGDTLAIAGIKIVVTPTNYLSTSWYGESLLIEKKSVSAMASLSRRNIYQHWIDMRSYILRSVTEKPIMPRLASW